MSDLNPQESKKQLISDRNYNHVYTNLHQLDALINSISGEGFANFNLMEEDAQNWCLLSVN